MTYSPHSNNDRSYAGKAALLVGRASTLDQEVSTRDQLNHMRQFSEAIGTNIVDEWSFEGISASKNWKRTDIEAIFNRKKTLDDFDIVIWYDVTRMTRGGVGHGHGILQNLKEKGIRVLFSAEPQYNGPDGELLLSLALAQGRKFVADLSRQSCRGHKSAIADGRMLANSYQWYGTDRLYLMEDGTPRHIVRLLDDGTQLVFEANVVEVESGRAVEIGRQIESFPPRKGRQSPRYTKQSRDGCETIPGNPKHVGVIHYCINKHLVDAWPFSRMIKELNQRGIPSPKGKLWRKRTIQNILQNPIYLGYYYSDKSSLAQYYRRADGGSAEIQQDDPAVEAGLKQPPTVQYPKEQWNRIDQPFMEDYLAPSLKELACEYVENILSQMPSGVHRQGDKHTESDYFLKHMFKAKDDGCRLTGRSSKGRKGKQYRYYCRANDRDFPGTRKNKWATLPANDVETVVLEALSYCMSDTSGLRDSLLHEITIRKSSATEAQDAIRAITQELGQVERKIRFMTDNLADYSEETAKNLLRENRLQREGLTRRLESIRRTTSLKNSSPEEAMSTLTNELGNIRKWIHTAPQGSVKRVVNMFVANAVADMDTRNIEFEFRLPSWALDDPEKLCVKTTQPGLGGLDANPEDRLLLRRYRYIWVGGSTGRYVQVEPVNGSDALAKVQVQHDPSAK